MKTPKRLFRTPPVTAYIDRDDMQRGARKVMHRIENVWDTHGCTAWLFVNGIGHARVMYDLQTALPYWQREYTQDFVGCYARRSWRDLTAVTLEQLVEDIAERLDEERRAT